MWALIFIKNILKVTTNVLILMGMKNRDHQCQYESSSGSHEYPSNI